MLQFVILFCAMDYMSKRLLAVINVIFLSPWKTQVVCHKVGYRKAGWNDHQSGQ